MEGHPLRRVTSLRSVKGVTLNPDREDYMTTFYVGIGPNHSPGVTKRELTIEARNERDAFMKASQKLDPGESIYYVVPWGTT